MAGRPCHRYFGYDRGLTNSKSITTTDRVRKVSEDLSSFRRCDHATVVDVARA